MSTERASETPQEPLHNGNYMYGNNPVFEVGIMVVRNGFVHRYETELDRSPAVSRDFILNGLEDIGQTAQVLEGPKVDDEPTTVEIAIARGDASDAQGYDAHFSTGSSSIRNNKKQAAEHALRSAADVHRPNVYVAAPGQGASSGWTPDEASYIRRTGRFVWPDGSPLPTMARQYQTLQAAGIMITRMSTDADGGVFGTAFGVAMEEGQLTHAHFNNLPISKGSGLLYSAAAEAVNQFDDRMTAMVSHDPQRLTKAMFEEAQLLVPAFSGDAAGEQRTTLQKARTSHTPDKLVTVSAGLSRGGKSAVHPAVYDTARLIMRHPEAKLTFQFPARAASIPEISDFLESLHHHSFDKLFPHPGNVQAIAHPGTRRGHVSYPTLRQTVRDYAYNR